MQMTVPQIRVRSLHDNLGGRTLAEVRLWFLFSGFDRVRKPDNCPDSLGHRKSRGIKRNETPKLTRGASGTQVNLKERREPGAPCCSCSAFLKRAENADCLTLLFNRKKRDS